MRSLASVVFVLVLLLGSSISTAGSSAQSPSISDYLPDTLPLDHAACFRIDGGGVLDFSTLVERFADIPDATAQLEALGWKAGAFRQFGCDAPPAGSAGWIDASVHRFSDAASAAAAVPFFAKSRDLGTTLQAVPAPILGDSTAALTGPASNGTEYTLYMSTGPLMFRVTGVAPAGDPAPDVEQVMTGLLAGSRIAAPPPEAPTRPSDTTAVAAYTILDLGTGTGNWSSANHINERGQVLMTTGIVEDPFNRLPRDQRLVIWQNGTVTDLTALGIDYAIAMNDVGSVLVLQDGQNLLYDSDSGSLAPLPGFAYDAYPADINNAGAVTGQVGASGVIVAGTSVVEIPAPPGFGFVEPAAINEAGDVVGTARPSRSDESIQQGFLFADGLVTLLDPAPGAMTSGAVDLNDAGQIIGNTGTRGMHSLRDPGRAFLYDRESGTMSGIGTLPGYENSIASAINNAGQVVGYSWLPRDWQPDAPLDQFRKTFLYDHRTGVLSDLNQLIPPGTGWQLIDAFDINGDGQIVGRGLNGGAMHAFVLNPVR